VQQLAQMGPRALRPLAAGGQRPQGARPHLRELLHTDPAGTPIRVADHCYGCTAGQGSSCGGALGAAVEPAAFATP
jgi:hypothetical protein